ncbi:GNAT family N-acetyltransferase [Streptomyces sp. NPDC048680]|uniref:GNAT family N-acetyltransferase n=1 Tax=Streptomyces sp. NPDC048680 TaxID=3155492 RepID=UPI0034478EE3
MYNYAITKDGALVGMCQTYRGAEPNGRLMGYWLHPAATGQGIATRATAAPAGSGIEVVWRLNRPVPSVHGALRP